jgi:hypothetical protein
MKYLLVPALLVVTVMLPACGGSKAREATTGSAFRKDLAKTEASVKGCIKSQSRPATLASSAARRKFIDCFAPSKQAIAIESCASRAIRGDVALYSPRLVHDLALCVERTH